MLTRHFYIEQSIIEQITTDLLKYNPDSIILFISGIDHPYFGTTKLHPNIIFKYIPYDISKFYQYDYTTFRPNIKAFLSTFFKDLYTRPIKIHIIGQWASPDDIKKEFQIMSEDGNGKWKNLQIVNQDEEPNYYILLNFPSHINQDYANKVFSDTKKVLFFHMEPSIFYKQFGFFADPPPIFKVLGTHKNQRNLMCWQIGKTYQELSTSDYSIQKVESETGAVMSAVVSSLYNWPGHKLRIDFLKFLEKEHPEFKLDLFGKSNDHKFTNYRRALPFLKKEEGLIPYKYTFNSENSSTEKIIDSILCECLCFYWGCPNLEDYIDGYAFIRLDINDPEKSYQVIINSIQNNEWEKRLPIIKKMKNKILNELQIFNHIHELLN
jgi:hypothetical protein